MNKKTKTILGLLLFISFIGIAYFSYQTLFENFKPSPKTETENKTVAPDFTVTDSEGKEVKLSSFIGKPIVVNFWTSWCTYCKIEMPYFNTASNAMKDEVIFLMIDVVDGQRETIEKGKSFIEENAFTFPVYFDTSLEASTKYGINSFPSTIFIDKEGKIAIGYRGAIDEQTLLEGIDLITQ